MDMEDLKGMEGKTRDSVELARVLWKLLDKEQKIGVLNGIYIDHKQDDSDSTGIWEAIVRPYLLLLLDSEDIVMYIPHIERLIYGLSEVIDELASREEDLEVIDIELVVEGAEPSLKRLASEVFDVDVTPEMEQEIAKEHAEAYEIETTDIVNCPQCGGKARWSKRAKGGNGEIACTECGFTDTEVGNCPYCHSKKKRDKELGDYCPVCSGPNPNPTIFEVKETFETGSENAGLIKKGTRVYEYEGPIYGAGITEDLQAVSLTGDDPFFLLPKRILKEVE